MCPVPKSIASSVNEGLHPNATCGIREKRAVRRCEQTQHPKGATTQRLGVVVSEAKGATSTNGDRLFRDRGLIDMFQARIRADLAAADPRQLANLGIEKTLANHPHL